MTGRPSFIAWLATVNACVAFLLLLAGALVTSTGSGLAIPDWPLAYGRLIPPLVGGIRFEYAHRVIAGVVLLLTTALVITLWKTRAPRTARRLGLAAWGLLIAQAVLGGVTVLHHLPPAISIAHAVLGQTFFAVSVCLPIALDKGARPLLKGPGPFLPLLLLAGAVYLELILGAMVRHTGGGLAWHVAGALVTFSLTSGLAIAMHRQHPRSARPYWFLTALVLLQLGLGGATWVSGHASPQRLITWIALVPSAHVAIGALLLAFTLHLLMPGTPSITPRMKSGVPGIYLELTKPRLTGLALVTVGAGWYLGTQHPADWGLLLRTLAGAALVGGGANALNQVLEHDIDARMRRTQGRPIPSGRLALEPAMRFGMALVITGLLWLLVTVNALACLLAGLTAASYLGLYTPLKRVTALCTLVGAIPGALPPLIGWAAAANTLPPAAWTLFLILFLWQLPHFLAIAWRHRDDYARAGLKMLPVGDPLGDQTGRQIILSCLALLPASLAPAIQGITGIAYFLGALLLSGVLLAMGIATARTRSTAIAFRLFLLSTIYLPALLLLMAIDKTPL